MGKKVIVVGGGPAGYVTAIRAAQLGAEVHLVEKKNLGGTCLNVGCIPTKALLHTAQAYRAAKEPVGGVLAENVSVDWDAMMAHKGQIVNRLVSGVKGLLRANGVTVHNGTAAMSGPHTVSVDGKETIEGDIIILASGSEPAKIPFPGADLDGVIDSTGALNMPQRPKSMVILGGGVVGIEFAYLYNALDVDVTVVEMLPEILPPVDRDISAILRKDLVKQGVKILTGTKVLSAEKSGSALAVKVLADGKEEQIPCEKLLVAVGRRANTAALGLDKAGIQTERGAIVTNDSFQTNVPGVYAIGDCNGKFLMAHAASAQGMYVVENLLGEGGYYNAGAIPKCIYTQPEVSSVGMTEEEVKAAGIPYQVGRFQLSGNGKSLIEGCENGLIKVIADTQNHQVLGVHMVGPRVTEVICEATLAINSEFTTLLTFSLKEARTYSMCSEFSFRNWLFTTSRGLSSPAIRMYCLLEQTVSSISSMISLMVSLS